MALKKSALDLESHWHADWHCKMRCKGARCQTTEGLTILLREFISSVNIYRYIFLKAIISVASKYYEILTPRKHWFMSVLK